MQQNKTAIRILALALLLGTHTSHAAEPVFGKIEPGAHISLGLSTSGIIHEVIAHPWQTVQPGDRLLSLDPRPFEIRLKQAQARLKRLKLADEEAEREYQRQQELFERMSIARRDLLLAEIERESARARLREAEAEHQLRKLELEYSRLTAPCKGIVTAVKAHPGQAVVNNMQVQPLIELTCTTPWQVNAMLDQEQRQQLKTGQIYTSRKGVQVKLLGISPWPDQEDPGKRHPARFQVVDPAGQPLQPGKRLEIPLP